MHGEENQVGTEERNPEVKLAQPVVEHPSRYLGVPMIDRAQHNHDWRHAHYHVEMGDDEHGIREGHIHDDVAEEQAGEPAIDERDDEAKGEQHRDGEMNVAAPQGQHPVVDLDGSRDGDDERRGGEEEPEMRVHAAHIHVVRPYDEAERADSHDSPYHHAIAEDVLSRMRADQIGNDAEGRKCDDVDFGMAEEPEQVLEQDRAAAAILHLLAHLDE